MNARPTHLPDYNDPPVIEVVLAIQFTPLAKFQAIHYGQVWDCFKREFPLVSEHPPLESSFETFGPAVGKGPHLKFEVTTQPLRPRLWFIAQENDELIQFQPDRFLHNWRQMKPGATYPHFESIKERYREELHTLLEFVRKAQLGSLEPNQCEITYINHIVSRSGEDVTVNLGRVFRWWNDRPEGGIAEQYEDAGFNVRYVVASDEGQPIGRLTVKAEPGRMADGRSAIQLTLSVKGKPAEPTIDAALKFLEVGRERIVTTFTRATTDEMHERWRRFQ